MPMQRYLSFSLKLAFPLNLVSRSCVFLLDRIVGQRRWPHCPFLLQPHGSYTPNLILTLGSTAPYVPAAPAIL